MPQLRILCIGRNAKDPLLESADSYLQRLAKFTKVELLRLKEGTLDFEQKQFDSKLVPGEFIVALDERGIEQTTRQLASRLEQWDLESTTKIAFLIGGADGLPPKIKEQARQIWSLSKLTLPHRMAQVLLLEQLYRAYTINRAMPYHRD